MVQKELSNTVKSIISYEYALLDAAVVKPNTPEGLALKLDASKNGNAYIFKNSDGKAVIIRHDYRAPYGSGNVVGNQAAHYNGGVVEGIKLDTLNSNFDLAIKGTIFDKLPTHFFWE